MTRFRIFDEIPLENVLKSRKGQIRKFIESKSEDEFLKQDKNQIVSEFSNKFKIESSFDFDNIDIETEDVNGTDYFIFKIPITTNDKDYFKLRPDNRIVWTYDVYIENNYLCFDVIDHKNNVEDVKNNAKDIINKIKRQSESVDKVIGQYNSSLNEFIENIYNERKLRISGRDDKLKSLKEEFKL